MNGAGSERLRRLQIALGAVTLLLAGSVFAEAIRPMLAGAQTPTTATVTGIVSATATATATGSRVNPASAA